MAEPTSEQRELSLVEKVDFRILNVANNEQKLQDLLSKFLVPLLLKGASEHASVRAKVATVAQRLKLFIKPPGVVLPVAALVDQFKSTASPVVRHLDMVFIQHSIGRLSAKDRRALLPALLRGISRVNSSTPALFDIVLQTLSVLKVPARGSQEDDAFAEAIGLADPADAVYVAERFGQVFLLSRGGSGGAASGAHMAAAADVAFFGLDQDDAWLRAGTNLAETRIRVAQFLASGAFAHNDDTEVARFMPSLYAAVHTDSRVSSLGEDLLKRTKVSLESKTLVEQLFAAHAVLPPAYRIRILNLLSRSSLSTSYTDEILKVVVRDMGANKDTSAEAAVADNGAAASSRSRGLEMAKLYKALFEYINWIARIGPNKQDFAIGRPLIEYLQQYIQDLGWPVPTSTGVDNETLRAKAYETIGQLAKGARMTMAERLALARYFFRSLTEDPVAEVVVNVDGALSSLSSVFAPEMAARGKRSGTSKTQEQEQQTRDRETIESELRAMLLEYIGLDGSDDGDARIRRSARHAAAKWANNCLRFADPVGRWIDILAAAGRRGERSDVVEEGHKGLDPWTYYSNNVDDLVLPQWPALVQTFFKERVGGEAAEHTEPAGMDVDAVSVFVNFPGDILDAFALAVNYCKRILLLTALTDFKVEPGWEQQVETLVRSDKASRDAIRAYLASSAALQTSLQDLLEAALEGMLLKDKPAVVEPCGRCFVELASLAPQAALAHLAGRTPELLPLATSNKKEVRKLAAAAIGILGAHPDNGVASVAKLKADLVAAAQPWKTAVGSELNATEGAFVSLAHLLSRIVFYDAADADRQRASLVDDVATLFPTAKEISEASMSFQDALFDALSQLWTAGIACLPGSVPDGSDADTNKTIVGFVDVLTTQAKKGNERAIAALGRLAVSVGADSTAAGAESTDTEKGADETDVTALILSKLYDLYEIKQAEAHFAIGGAITAAVACWDADVVELSLDVQSASSSSSSSLSSSSSTSQAKRAPFRIAKRPHRLTTALDKILTDGKTTKPALLKASGIWLFSLIQHCAHLPEVQSRLRECQVAFMRLLSARDELVQETASRGLALVYEKGDAPLKGDLVRDLVASFTGSGTQLKVDEDTELFDAGALPTGEGKSVTSYRDIVNLANEVGDQTLIYKFMSLAANAATWSTRSAFGRFGLSNILSSEAETVDPKLYPKLFRYRFDPNPNVQRSMNDIWKALVKDSNAVIETHFAAIMEDLLKSILGKEWRVREASAAAIADLVQGRPFTQYEAYYQDIWARALKVLDDVKGSVREAALRLCITLSNTLVRQLEEDGSGGSAAGARKNAVAMMNEALPFLMSDKGIESGVEDVKVFATLTVLKIAKHGGKSLRPYIAAMVPHLLGLLSTIEPQAFNYYYMRSGDDDREKLDKMRSAMVSQSPISEAIENSLRSVDAAVLTDLAPGIEAAMKSAVGMPTKIGCGRVLQTLATRHALDFAPHSARFLQLLGKQLLDRNDEVSQSYAKTAAYVVRTAPDAARARFVGHLVDLYFGAEDETRRQKVADAVLFLSKISPDHFNALEARLLPLSYLARHDADDYVHKAADEVWSKHAGSSLSVARYVPEIAALTERALDTAQWALKHAGARTAAAAVGSVLAASDLSGQVNVAHLTLLWPLYERALALKTFDGKETLLEVLPDVVSKGKALWQDNAKVAASLRKMATVEAKRNNDAYRVHAFKCLWRVAAAREDEAAVGMWDDIVAIVTPHLEALKEWEDAKDGGDRMDIDSANGSKKDTAAATKERLVRQAAENALDAVARGYHKPSLRRDPRAVLAAVWAALAPFVSSNAYILVRRTTWYKAVGELLEAAASTDVPSTSSSSSSSSSESGGDLALAYLASLDVDTPEAGTEEQRSSRAKALKALVRASKKGALGAVGSEAASKIKAAVDGALSTERSLDVQKLLREAVAEGKK
ncbi:proteasome component ECM29 [Sporothrix schenckii 1099-18]|uniref:Proteasome component ECM29 n=1 Tax=Sporothrix schenckii 1099-18 TaxID=1397361 RepID=A0A0F2MCY6_SPOSC|nr:proteasome component ECM29 [Sporothrix schenckii 1099-18]KJR86011.1 proteasome component ECM29 [Sporothrix schenckii 1099-18]